MNWRRCFWGIALLLGIATSAVAKEPPAWLEPFSFSGWVDTIQSVRTHAPRDRLTSRARLRLECSATYGALYGFLSGNAEKNWEIENETGIDLQEAWLEYAADFWDVRIGRQIIIWGKADGIQITDIISPPDYTESVTRELDEIRMPVDALKFRLLNPIFDTQFIWIPVFKPAVYPSGNNPWAILPSLPEHIRLKTASPVEPDSSLKNSEAAMKISAYRSGIDLAASVFYTWDDTPARHRSISSQGNTTTVSYYPQHHRLTVLGLEFSRPWSDFVFRGESAYYVGKYQEAKDIDKDPVKKDQVKWLGGVDWSPGSDWRFTAQLGGTRIFHHEKYLLAEKDTMLATLRISKELFNQTLSASAIFFYELNHDDFYVRPTLDYAMTDALHLLAGSDLFWGNKGQFGIYRENSQVWGKIKYSF